MNQVDQLYHRMVKAMGLEAGAIPAAFITLFKSNEFIPEIVSQYEIDEETIMCCQAVRHATHGHPVLLTPKNIGCVAAAISLGLVGQNQTRPLEPTERTYTLLMKQQLENPEEFIPPSPKDFTSGEVYACKHSKKRGFCLFGASDSGRFQDVETAQRAVAHMMAIQPPTTQAVFFYGAGFQECEIAPDVVLLSVRPVELTRIIQGYQYITGEPVQSVINPLRAVDSDLIVRPYLTGKINVSTYCLGARVVGRFEGDRLGIGIPIGLYETVVRGMEQSITGYPFHLYAGSGAKKT